MEAMTLVQACRAYVETSSRAAKLRPRAPSLPEAPPPRERVQEVSWKPGRSARLEVVARAPRAPRPGALKDPSARAHLLHVFLHHEIQAAELSAWAIAAFPETPAPFRDGLARILTDEARHARSYAARLRSLGARYGDFPVRDWFWERVPSCRTPRMYTALMGLGFEAGNLEHAERFEGALRAAGDEESAEVVRVVGQEEVAHVRFAAQWFVKLGGKAAADGGPDYTAWESELPPPITPALLQGRPLAKVARRRAGLGEEFLSSLEAAGGNGATSRRSHRR